MDNVSASNVKLEISSCEVDQVAMITGDDDNEALIPNDKSAGSGGEWEVSSKKAEEVVNSLDSKKLDGAHSQDSESEVQGMPEILDVYAMATYILSIFPGAEGNILDALHWEFYLLKYLVDITVLYPFICLNCTYVIQSGQICNMVQYFSVLVVFFYRILKKKFMHT